MPQNRTIISSLAKAVDYFQERLHAHPERNLEAAYQAVMAGKRRLYPVLSVGHLVSPDDTGQEEDDYQLPEVTVASPRKAPLAKEIIEMLAPLKMLNPIAPCFNLGVGTGTLVTCFGIPVNTQAVNTPAYNRKLEDVLSDPPPAPETAGVMPQIREKIEMIKKYAPNTFKIALPDMQGPFNIAHAILGTEVFTAPYLEPEKFHRLMERITNLWLQARQKMLEWIEEDRRVNWYIKNMICECSVNLISPDMYKKFVLPYDQQIADKLGNVSIHPCSGPHVFKVTLENLPVEYIQAGFIAKTAAGSISVTEALRLIGKRPIVLDIGQELPEGKEYEFICQDLDRYKTNPRLLFSYTGMHWRKKDRPLIRGIHRRLDEYWTKNLAGNAHLKSTSP